MPYCSRPLGTYHKPSYTAQDNQPQVMHAHAVQNSPYSYPRIYGSRERGTPSLVINNFLFFILEYLYIKGALNPY
jgi:hypothetical protein